MGGPPVHGDNPRALARALSYVQVDKHGMAISYQLHQCRPYTSRDILRAKIGKEGFLRIYDKCQNSCIRCFQTYFILLLKQP